jgi:hypothetical protein
VTWRQRRFGDDKGLPKGVRDSVTSDENNGGSEGFDDEGGLLYYEVAAKDWVEVCRK